jgi:acetyltransferase-like isoleucine patch superfamily enzyme
MLMRRYSPSELVGNAVALLLTRVFFPGARLVRRPVYIRGRRHAALGQGLTIGYRCRFDLGGSKNGGTLLTLGRNCHLGDNVHIVASERVVIGDNCLMASNIFITDTSHGRYQGQVQSRPDSDPNLRPLQSRPVVIGHNVWIGENVCVLPGVSIGDGCIVNAHAVVTKSVPAGCIVAGVPARVIKRWSEGAGEWQQA